MNLTEVAQRAAEHRQKLAEAVYVIENHIVIKVGDEYNIAINRCDTAEKLLHWVWHLCEKTWMTPEILRYFIEVASKQSGIKMQES